MATELYAHVPSLRIDEDDIAFARGRLLRLSFEDWSALESEFGYADSKYRKTAPVFWRRALDTDGDTSQAALTAAAYEAVRGMHTALLLDLAAPLIPTPVLSCLYIRHDTDPELAGVVDNSVLRFIGPMEREFIVYGSPLPYVYGAERLASLDGLYEYLEASGTHATRGEIAAAIAVLEETARPDSWYAGDAVLNRAHGFVRCMAALEGLVLPPEDERVAGGEITQTFARHAAALFSHVHEDRDAAVERFAALYRLRSELMHGRSIPDPRDEDVNEQLRAGRAWLRNAVCAALVLQNALPEAGPLWRQLQAASEDADAQSRLAAILAGPGDD